MSDEHAAAEYKTAASTSTCNMGTFFEAWIVETLRSIIQIRYASNPEHVRVSMRPEHYTSTEVCLPELNKLVAIVNEMNAVIHCEVALRKKFVEPLVCG